MSACGFRVVFVMRGLICHEDTMIQLIDVIYFDAPICQNVCLLFQRVWYALE